MGCGSPGSGVAWLLSRTKTGVGCGPEAYLLAVGPGGPGADLEVSPEYSQGFLRRVSLPRDLVGGIAVGRCNSMSRLILRLGEGEEDPESLRLYVLAAGRANIQFS